jgi:tetratricopeptide (TPR) repeat protein
MENLNKLNYENQEKKRNRIFAFFTFFLFLFLIIGGFFFIINKKNFLGKKMEKTLTEKIDFTIPGVPYFGIHNRFGDRKDAIPINSASTILSIMEYWNPGANSYSQINSIIFDSQQTMVDSVPRSFVLDFFNKALGDKYSAELVTLKKEEIKKYINPEARTPLLVFMPFNVDQSAEINFFPATLIIGLRESENKLIIHDFWLGNNYEITFEEFEKRWDIIKEEEQNKYVVIRPRNLNEVLSRMESERFSPYPERTEVMLKTENMIKNYVLGYVSVGLERETEEVVKYFLNVENDPNFSEWLPNLYKVYTYSFLSGAYLAKDDIIIAKDYAQKAFEINHDLDKPFKDWPGALILTTSSDKTGVHCVPWIAMGDIYYKTGEYQKAKENYDEAEKINSSYPGLKEKNSLTRMNLNKKVDGL